MADEEGKEAGLAGDESRVSPWILEAPAVRAPGPEPKPAEPTGRARWLLDEASPAHPPPPRQSSESRRRRRRRRRPPRRVLAAAVACVAALGVGAFALLQSGDGAALEAPARTPASDPSVAPDRAYADRLEALRGLSQVGSILGDPEAPVLTVYTDVASPEYAAFDAELLDPLIRRFVRPGHMAIQVRTVTTDDPGSLRTALAVQAAGLQTRFWQAARLIAAGIDVEELAQEIPELDEAQLRDDAASARVQDAIDRSADIAAEAGVSDVLEFALERESTTFSLDESAAPEQLLARLEELLG